MTDFATALTLRDPKLDKHSELGYHMPTAQKPAVASRHKE